jgi:putative phosphoesterase
MASKIGIIADTHGLLRDEAIEILKTCDCIVHAGDIGSPTILKKLKSIAPTFAIRGNIDKGFWSKKLPDTDVVKIEKRVLYLIHSLNELDLDPAAADFDAVISGHSHVPKGFVKNGVLYFNPGSAGPKRFRLPVTMGRITLRHGRIDNEILKLLP